LGDFELGTYAITYLVSVFTRFNMSYGNVFLVFNLFGFVGMLGFAAALRSATQGKGRFLQWLAFLLPFLPGLSFWSSAIGKDALTFMGAGLACWAAIEPAKRYPAFIIAFLAFLLGRPHMAGIYLASAALAVIWFSRVSMMKKSMLILLLSPAAVAAVLFGLEYAGLGDAKNTGDVAEYFENRQGQNMEGSSSVDIAGMSIPMRLFTYTFRPLILDAEGILGFAVSLENAVILAMFLVFLGRLFSHRSTLPRFASGFYIIYVVVASFVLANTTANLGIAIRQKWMFLPMLILLMVALMGADKARRSSRTVRPSPVSPTRAAH
jgi:hypothetical protein